MRRCSSPVLGLVITLALCVGCSASGAQQPATRTADEPSRASTPSTTSSPRGEVPTVGTATPSSLPGLREPGRKPVLVRRPLPAAAVATDRLAPGFPGYLGPVRGSRITSSSLSPAGTRLRVALDASTTLPAAQVLHAGAG